MKMPYGAVVILTLSMSMSAARALQAAPTHSQVTYAEFMKLDVETRMRLFSTLPAESKAALKRAHAEEWLRKHRSKLTTSQVDAVNQTIRFITPELYTQPSDPSLRKREEELKRSLVCSIGRDRAQEAFMLKQSQPQPETHTLASLASDWLEWFTECVIR